MPGVGMVGSDGSTRAEQGGISSSDSRPATCSTGCGSWTWTGRSRSGTTSGVGQIAAVNDRPKRVWLVLANASDMTPGRYRA